MSLFCSPGSIEANTDALLKSTIVVFTCRFILELNEASRSPSRAATTGVVGYDNTISTFLDTVPTPQSVANPPFKAIKATDRRHTSLSVPAGGVYDAVVDWEDSTSSEEMDSDEWEMAVPQMNATGRV